MPRNAVPDLQKLQTFAVNRQGQYEVVRQTQYDFLTYAAAGQTSLQFFQIPQGQGGKTIADTNLEVAGSLPQPKWFLVESIEVHFFPGLDPVTLGDATAASNFTNDVYSVLTAQASLQFFIGSKTYVEEAPLIRFPPKTRLYGESAIAADNAAAATSLVYDYASACGRPYFVDPEVLLIPNQNFKVTISFPSAVALPSTEDARIGVVLDGILYRQSQ